MKKWKTVVQCAIGVSHQQQNLPCQDYGDYLLFGNKIVIGAVADGAGSAKYSDIGSKIAVNTAISFLEGYFDRLLENIKLNPDKPRRNTPSINQAQDVYNDLLKEVLKAINDEAQKSNYQYQDLACTLIIFFASDKYICAMQIGDGFIAVRPVDEDLQLLFTPDKGEYINETTFVTSSNAFEEMQIKVLDKPCSFICASTDGLEKVAINFKNWQPFPPFFNPLEEYMKETAETEEDKQYIIDFLNSERLNARTNDDKTLLLALLTE
ncbi:PP2C family serine/threonine-protein phosphatase [Geminocystis sp. CENA526]|uniref:PP2C family serine/threonine-protein phosphatase n=1 Tax=Geminocystis sp. CENA526 TaxID=1355871 RepID=UPI003D6FD907